MAITPYRILDFIQRFYANSVVVHFHHQAIVNSVVAYKMAAIAIISKMADYGTEYVRVNSATFSVIKR